MAFIILRFCVNFLQLLVKLAFAPASHAWFVDIYAEVFSNKILVDFPHDHCSYPHKNGEAEYKKEKYGYRFLQQHKGSARKSKNKFVFTTRLKVFACRFYSDRPVSL